MGIGDWGLGIREWGPITNPQTPKNKIKFKLNLLLYTRINYYNLNKKNN